MNRKSLFPFVAYAALCLSACTSSPATSEGTAVDSLTCEFTREGISVALTADYPVEDATLQTALAAYMCTAMLAEVPDTAFADGQSLLAACADAAWGYMKSPLIADDESGIDIILGEGVGDDSEIPTAEELAEFDGGEPRSTYTAQFPMLYDAAGYVTWQCSWSLYAEGTPHPAFGLTGATFRKSDGKRLGHEILRDTSSKGFRQLLAEALYQWLAEEWEMTSISDGEMAEILQEGCRIDALPLPREAPYLLPGGVALPYQEYELTGGRSVQVLVLPYSKVRPYLAIDL